MARHMIWAAALLLLLPGSVRATEPRDGGICEKDQATQQRGGQPPAGSRKGDKDKPGDSDRSHQGPTKWWIDAKLRAELGINDQQSAAVDQIWQKSLPALRDGRARLEKLEEALSVMTRDVSDEALVLAQIERVENTRAELNKGRTLMIFRMNLLLTADQRAKVKAIVDRREPPRRGSSSL